MPRFFIRQDQISCVNDEKTVLITGDDAHHISFSLRMKPKEKISVCDMQKKVYFCEIEKIDSSSVLCKVISQEKIDIESELKIYLYQALPKFDKFETIIQKSIECGVYEIIPFSSERCIAKIDARDVDKKRERFLKISESAAKQSGRTFIPDVKPIMNFKEAIEEAAKCDISLFCYEGEESLSIKKALEQSEKPKTISIVIGSEGGFSKKEVEFAKESGMKIVGLGKRILRCETAPIFALSCVSYAFEL